MKTATAKAPVIHYHKDTEEIHATLTVEAVYKTSKELGRYKGRSQSNGKLLFVSCSTGKNVYFTKQEWIDGANSPKNIDKGYIHKPIQQQAAQVVRNIIGQLVVGKSILEDTKEFNGQEAVYLGIHPVHGVKVEYRDGGATKMYFPTGHFNTRFKIKSVGIADKAVDHIITGKVTVETPKKFRRKKGGVKK